MRAIHRQMRGCIDGICYTMPESSMPTAEAVSAILGADAPVSTMAIPDLLAQSLAHHLQYRQAIISRDLETRQKELREAASLRALAERADPSHADPAWHQHVSTHEYQAFTHDELHAELLNFYVQELGLTHGA